MKKIELLAPVGDFDCLKAAVQNGADSVYLGASSFSARASAKNFDLDELKDAIKYAKLRSVDVHLTLNTLLQENEIESALNLANDAYSLGIDAIIVQDFGLAKLLIKNLPDLAIHASTQMTIHNIEGVKLMEKLGFKRVVLARELSIDEIKNICQNSDIEIEAFIHGALCISYSGRCYMSSMIGGRSGNRGKCAQSCRLPYSLYNSHNEQLDKGYILSPRDLCSLDELPSLVNAGVDSFKIEGRMKNPDYVATVTRIYRKYFDKIINNEEYIVDQNDIKELMQVFNRGGFSSGHLEIDSNRKLIYPVRPSNIGLYLGKVKKFNSNKGYITLCPEEEIEIGDSISFEKENTKYTISELVENGKNIASAKNKLVQIGRMKGNIHENDAIYKIASKTLTKKALSSFEKENKKIELDAKISIQENKPIILEIKPLKNNIYRNIKIVSDIIPIKAINQPISKEKVESQLKKTGNTEFEFRNIDIVLDDNLYIQPISALNELRRNALSKLEENAIKSFTKNKVSLLLKQPDETLENNSNKKISILLNNLNKNFDYTKLESIEYVYIPLHYYLNKEYENTIKQFKTSYIYLPTILRQNKIEYIKKSIPKIVENYQISGFVISNLSDLEIIPKDDKYKIVGNYTLNVFNNQTIQALNDLNFDRIIQSIELPNESSSKLHSSKLEAIVYGKAPSMTLNYCLLGKSNRCYKECPRYCEKDNYFIRDRLNFDFEIRVDNKATITTIFNSKITSILPSSTNASVYRIDILDENIDEINYIISHVRQGTRIEGQNYTNANLNREI